MSAPYRNNDEILIQRLTETLQNVSPPERREQMIAEAKNRLMPAQKTRGIERETLWNYQLDILCRKGCADIVGVKEDRFLSFLEPLKPKFLAVSGKLDCIVLPPNLITTTKKMNLVELDGKRGISYLTPALIQPADGVKRPDAPYLMLDVEDGREMIKVSPDNCMKHFSEVSRLGCTADDGEMIAIYWPEILKHHYIDCPGSRCVRGAVPCVNLWFDEPKLSACPSGSDDPYCGSASCGSIFVP